MEALLIGIFYALSGFFMKLSDDAYDEHRNKKFAVATGIICGLIIGFLVTNSTDATYIFFGILLGTLASKKIDGIHHILTLLTFVLVAFLFGIPEIGLVTLFICFLAAYLDEIGNDNPKLAAKSHFLEIFFRYRFAMKITIGVLSILGLYQALNGFSIPGMSFLSPLTIIYFLMFEISYELGGRSSHKIYNGIYKGINKLKTPVDIETVPKG